MAYHERLIAPMSWWGFALAMVASVWLAMIVAIPEAAAWLVTALAVVVALGVLGRISATPVSVDDRVFRAGPARLPLEYVGEVSVLSPVETKRLLGVDADARAFLVVKPYLKRAVKVEINDHGDPTPYWVVSSRRPDRLAEALRAKLSTPAPGGTP